MDPVTVSIVTALSAGGAAVAKGVASAAGKDLFEGLRRLISSRYEKAGAFLEAVESDPASQPERQMLGKQLEQAGAGQDEELKNAALALLDAVEDLRNEPKAVALFDFDQLRVARNMQFEDIDAAQVLRVRGAAEIDGDFTAKGIRQKPAQGPIEKN